MKVAVLRGGHSQEAEVSAVSAREVAAGLDDAGHHATIVDLSSELATALLQLQPDVVFPALHGPPGEDGTVQGLLTMLELPYVGANVHGSAAAMDKKLAKLVFKEAGLPIAADVEISSEEPLDDAAARVKATIGERIVIKPATQGSALGVTLLPNGGDLIPAIDTARGNGYPVLAEPFILGREITVGVLDCHGTQPITFPVIEIRTAEDSWYDFENRYAKGKSEHIIPAPMSDEATRELQSIALQAHQALRLRDLSRADFIVTDSEEIYLLEVNTLPGMTPTSLFPDGARAMGIEFPQLMDQLVQSAFERGN